MTTWTMDQVRQASGIRAKAHVDATQVKQHGDEVWEAARSKMFRSMSEIAHTFALEIDARDIQFAKEDAGYEFKVEAWWEPKTNEVELRGGHVDGQILAFQGAPHEPLFIVRPSTPAIFAAGDAEFPEDLSPVGIEFCCAGWSEDDRRWIYEAR